MSKHILAIDTETHLFSPGNMAPPVVCLSYATNQAAGVIADKELIVAWLTDHLNMAINQKIIIVGHTIAYDMQCILRSFPAVWDLVFRAYDADGIVCTEIREKLLDIANDEFTKDGYTLADLSFKRLHKKLEKEDTWRLRYAELDDVPIENWPVDAVDYAVNDAQTALDLHQEQLGRALEYRYNMPTQYEDTRADFALKLMSTWGITTDSEFVKKRWTETADNMTVLAKELAPTGILTYKPPNTTMFENELCSLPETKKSTKVIRNLVENSFTGPELPLTAGGSVSTSADTIDQCDDPILIKLQDFKKLEKDANTYLRHFMAPLIHASFYGIGAASDRTSSSKPNLQNLPRKPGFRECFVPRPGYKFIAADFDAHEMRTLAQVCLDIVGRSNLAERFQEDPEFDPHSDFSRNSGIDRQHAKIANFGYPGGLGPTAFVGFARGWGVDLTDKQSHDLKQAWFEQWPEMRDYFKHMNSLVGPENYATMTIPQSGFVRKGVDYKQASNGYFSSLAAHGSKAALWEVSGTCYCKKNSSLYGSRPVVYVHDEIIIETPENMCEQASVEIVEIMERAMKPWTKDIPSRASAKIMERWTK